MSDQTQTALRPIDSMDRRYIARLVCGNDRECDVPCDDCPRAVWDAVNRVMAAIDKAGCVVMAREGGGKLA